MLPRSVSSLPATDSGWRRSSRMRSATSTAVSVPSRSSSSTTNSSPPKRAAVSLERMLFERRLATSIRVASPAPWPRLSLIVLKSSMSRNITPSSRSSRLARPIAWRTRSTNSARLGRLVTGIVEGLVGELLLEGLALADVARVQDDPAHVLVVEQVACAGSRTGAGRRRGDAGCTR